MNLIYALLLGIIEGLTEFIPVSSTAHMLIVQKIFNLPSDPGMFAFLILVQIGPLLALLVYFWKDYLSLIKAFFARPFSTQENKMAWYIIIATIPAGLAGVLLEGCRAGLVSEPSLGSRHPFVHCRASLVLGGMAWQALARPRLDDVAGCPHHRFISGAGRFSRFIPFRLDDSGRHVAQF
jgi:undecaprenyl pyrophosphate phosphatase UppP